jgi:hypothetical protein
MNSSSSVLSRFFCADRHSFTRTAWMLIAVLSLSSVLTARAAPQTFWPFNSFPPSAWSFSSASGAQIAFSLQGGGLVLARNFVITNLNNSIVLPALGDSVTNKATVRMDCQLSYDFGAHWDLFSGSGDMSLSLSHTNDMDGARMFGTEISYLNIVLSGPSPGGPPRLFFIQESPFLASVNLL